MEHPVTAESIVGLAVFRKLSKTLREQIANLAVGRAYPAGSIILEYHDRSHEVFFIVSGAVRVAYLTSAGKEITFRDQSAGEAFGLLSAVDGQPRSATVHALQDSFVVILRNHDFRTLLTTQPDFANAVMCQLSSLVRSLSARVIEYSALQVANRVRAELLRLARPDSRTPLSGVLSPAPTHAEIASRVGTHREAVTRELNALGRAGLLARDGHSIVITDLKKLRALCARDLGL